MDDSIFANRRIKLQRRLIKSGLDALIVLSPANRFYLSGFELHDGQCDESSGFLLVCATGENWLFTDSRYELAAEKLWPGNRICVYRRDAAEKLAKILVANAARAGFERTSSSWSFIHKLSSSIRTLPVLQPVSGLVEDLRMIKEPGEIASLKKSFALNHRVLAWLNDEFASIPGMTEDGLAWEIEKKFREEGASELAFSTIVASGTHGALPHAEPRSIKISSNSPLLIDLGCRVENYCSDQTRTWWLGAECPAHFKKTLDLVKQAQKAALSIMKSGIPCSEVYNVALEIFKQAGQEAHFTHGLGHGVGLQTHEAPSLSPASDTILQSGMVVTVEPGLYYPEWGGVRWENTVIVQDDGISLL